MEKDKVPIYKRWWFSFIIFLIIGFIFNFGIRDNFDQAPDESATKTEAEAPKLSPEEQFSKDNDISKDLTTNIFAACNAIGISTDNISDFTPTDNWADGKSYKFLYEGYYFNVNVNLDETINGIKSGDAKFYENGTAVLNVNDKIVSLAQQTKLMIRAEDDVKNNLKAPSTAEFPGKILEADKWNVTRYKDIFIVTSYVDSQNSFGAMIRSNFQCTYNWDGSDSTDPDLTDITIQ